MATETHAATPAAETPQPAPQSAALVPAGERMPPRDVTPTKYDPDDPIALYMDQGVFGQLQRVAKLMAAAELVPAHLRSVREKRAPNGDVVTQAIDRTADCFLVAAQAFRWRLDPFAVAQCTFVTSGKLGYEGKLIAGVVNTHKKMAGNLRYAYSGAPGDDRKVVVSGRLKGEDVDRTVEGTVGQWKTANEKWRLIPDQMLSYRGAREWTRRHLPEAILGIQADEEVEAIDVQARSSRGRTFAPARLDELTESLAPAHEATPEEQPQPAEAPSSAPGKACLHAQVAPRVAFLPPTKSVVCPDCSAEVRGTAERQPGDGSEDEEPTLTPQDASKPARKGR